MMPLTKAEVKALETLDHQIKRLQEQMHDKTHVSQVGGQDSSKSLQRLTDLYAKRRKLLGV